MRFDIYTLQLFVAVLEEGSIAAAAEREHIAASALSKRISELERSVGQPLFRRQARGVEPTCAGHALARGARAVLHKVEDLSAEIDEFSQGVRGRVRVMANLSSITQFLPAELSGFLRRHPNVQVDLEEGVSTACTRAVADNAADIGIFTQAEQDFGLTTFPYHHDALVLVAPVGHPLAGASAVSFLDTLDFDHVGMHRGSAADFLLTREASAANRVLRQRFHVTSYDAMVAMVKAGLGVGVIPVNAIALYARDGLRVIPLTDAWARRRLKLCVRSPEALSGSARLLLDHLVAAAAGEDGGQHASAESVQAA